ncbi:hypothetical protein [Alkalicoccobacillus murimartini]|uniref:Glucan phosphoethanolaminetransferase (Alkaline phosphatase superfamily) n=1 Tax=Alkalicoccobacillus murimartini TaxID=171685 RepID=A0ABT9YGD3_9BACI|nr:hypothetical protein [Alkalicoccobacillus murimartini]MDQ0206928.1 glucan phosphoethanolaminetransferase (alkaline phosphatase superfamily) [Alkalicoccobacillus murimartini]
MSENAIKVHVLIRLLFALFLTVFFNSARQVGVDYSIISSILLGIFFTMLLIAGLASLKMGYRAAGVVDLSTAVAVLGLGVLL